MQAGKKKDGKQKKEAEKKNKEEELYLGRITKIWGKIFCAIDYFNKNTHKIVGGTSGK